MKHLPDTQPDAETDHIASVVAHCQPAAITALVQAIEALPGLEVPERDERGKLVVLMEAASERQLLESMRAVEQLPGMISVSLVYHQIDS